MKETFVLGAEAWKSISAVEGIFYPDIPPIGIAVTELLLKAGLCKTKSEAVRSIIQGGVYLSNIKVESSFARLALRDNRFILIDFTTIQKVQVRQISIEIESKDG
jgi:tyrosyl-tRNA synthetase